MNRLRFCTVITALAFLFASASARAQTDLGKRVSIDVNTVAPQEVFDSLARSLNCEAAVDPQVQQPVTLRVVNVSARTALSAICESIGCRYRLDGKKLVIEPLLPKTKDKVLASRIQASQLLQNLKRPMPQGMRFDNAPLSSVLAAISDASGFEITVEPIEADKKVTVDLSGQTFQEALKKVIELAGTEGVVAFGVADGSKPKIKIKVRAKK
jgi:type II secretory pathway component GspD/PulD (secretin)